MEKRPVQLLGDTDLRATLCDCTRRARITVGKHPVIAELELRGYEVTFRAEVEIGRRGRRRERGNNIEH